MSIVAQELYEGTALFCGTGPVIVPVVRFTESRLNYYSPVFLLTFVSFLQIYDNLLGYIFDDRDQWSKSFTQLV